MSLSFKLKRILREISKDEWVSAVEIGKKCGLTPHTIGAQIGVYLLNTFVERRTCQKHGGRSYEYRQRVRIERTRKNEPKG